MGKGRGGGWGLGFALIGYLLPSARCSKRAGVEFISHNWGIQLVLFRVSNAGATYKEMEGGCFSVGNWFFGEKGSISALL